MDTCLKLFLDFSDVENKTFQTCRTQFGKDGHRKMMKIRLTKSRKSLIWVNIYQKHEMELW